MLKYISKLTSNNLKSMALTEEQKRKIEEEEYRKVVREKIKQSPENQGLLVNVSNPRVGKKIQIAGSLIMILGMIIIMSSQYNGVAHRWIAIAGLMVILVGVACTAVGRIQNWYNWK